jgi:diguanylate cyclase (GGDEF)-like protein
MQRGRDGSLVPVDVSATALTCDGEPAICYVIRDATPRKARENGLLQSRSEAEQRANYLTHRDTLTGLANRQSFKNDLRKAIANSRLEGGLAVLLLDINDFSSLNDTLGANVGDAVLMEIASRLRQILGSRALLARAGNDEFAATVQPVTDPGAVARIALKLQTALSAPMKCLHYQINTTVNIGFSLYQAGVDADTLLGHADLALSRAKSHGRGDIQLFNSKMDDEVRRRLEILLSLGQALERNELRIHYQPVVEIDSGKVLGLEALVRWQHPRLGWLSPADFIPAAEQRGLIVPLGEQVLRLVCEQVVQWRKGGLTVVPVAVNVSPQQFQRQSVAKLVERVLGETGMEARDLAIEITESSLMSGPDRYASQLHALRAMGVRILVDDFGTGYSSLSYLKHLPLDTLKIDGSFIANVHTNSTDEAIVSAILAMARSLGLNVVAEGVESQDQLAVLARHGCQMAQGYYFSRAMSADRCGAMLRELANRPSLTDALRLRLCIEPGARTVVAVKR